MYLVTYLHLKNISDNTFSYSILKQEWFWIKKIHTENVMDIIGQVKKIFWVTNFLFVLDNTFSLCTENVVYFFTIDR